MQRSILTSKLFLLRPVLADEQTLNNLQVQEMTFAVALVENLGGGWDRSQLPTPHQVTASPPKSETIIEQ